MNAGESAAPGNVRGTVDGDRIDWEALRTRAREAMRHAYVPYSRFPVGAAALTADGRVVSGCNVENASYGLTLCAECGLVSALHAGGGGRLVAFTCCDRDGAVLMPCGRCRQLLFEHGGPGLLVDSAVGIVTLNELLPQAFGPGDLEQRAAAAGPAATAEAAATAAPAGESAAKSAGSEGEAAR